MSILNVNKINPVGGGSTVTIAGIASVTSSVISPSFVGNLTGNADTASGLSGNPSINTTGIITATNVSVGSSVTAATFHGSGANLTGLSVNTNPLQVLEEFEVPCDGTSVTTAKGTVSISNQFTAQPLTTTFADLDGSTISYQPPDNTKIVIYSFSFAGFYGDADPIAYGHIYLDGVAVSDHPFTERGDDLHTKVTWSHAFRIEPSLSANAATGRVQSWNSAKTIKIMIRDHTNSYDAVVHQFVNTSAPGSSTNTSNGAVRPTIGIKAIGSV